VALFYVRVLLATGSILHTCFQKKNLPFSLERRQALIEVDHPQLSIRRPCELIGLHRGTFYYQPAGETPLNLELMRLIDEAYTCHPFYR